jgi:phage recombination protein Bet
MTAPNTQTAVAPASQNVPKKDAEIEYIPVGSESAIKLSVHIIRNYVATPTKQGDLPDDRECIRFLMLCRSRRLNPFEAECFLLGYRNSTTGDVDWSLITAHVAFLKRAYLSPDFDGMDSGTIVTDTAGKLIEREGDFLYPGDKLLGGWATVFSKKLSHPIKRRVALETFRKSYGRWLVDPAGLIVKCAEADALRSAFPAMLGALYTEVEQSPISIETTMRAPDFTGGSLPERQPKGLAAPPAPRAAVPAPAKTAAPAQKPPQTPQAPPEGVKTPAAAQTGQEPAAVGQDNVSVGQGEPEPAGEVGEFVPDSNLSEATNNILFLAHRDGVPRTQVNAFMLATFLLDQKRGQKDLSECSTKKLEEFAKLWDRHLKDIRNMPTGEEKA